MAKQILKKVLLFILPAMLCAVLFGCVYLQHFQQLHTKSHSVKLNDAYDTATQQLDNEQTVTQEFSYRGSLYGVGLVFHITDPTEPGHLRFRLEDVQSGQILADQTITFVQITSESYSCFWLDAPLQAEDHALRIVVQAQYDNPETANKLTLYKSAQPAESFGLLTENGEAAEGSLAVLAINELLGTGVTKAYWALAVVVSVLTGLISLLVFCGRAEKTGVTVLIVLLAGLLYQCVLPPQSAPDEIIHYNSAYWISNEWLGVENVPGTVVKRECDTVEAFNDFYTSAYTYQYILDHFWEPAGEQSALVESNEQYLQGYALPRLVPALGITIARLLGWGGVFTAYFTRLLCLLVYCALVALAHHWMPFAKKHIAVTALLPIALHLGGSFSYDSVVMGLAFAIFALSLDLAYGKCECDRKKLLILALLCVAIAPLKSVYITLPFLVLLIPQNAFSSKRSGWLYKAGTIAAAMLHFGWYNLNFIRYSVSAPAVQAAEGSAVAATMTASATYTIPYVLTHLGVLFKLVLNTFFGHFTDYVTQLFGGNLGYLHLSEIQLNVLIVFGFVLLWLLSALPTQGEHCKVGVWPRMLCFGVFVFTLAMLVAACITWTPMSYDYIWGFQGRYLLPVLPCVLLAARSGLIVKEKPDDAILLGAGWMLNVLAVLNVLIVVLGR